MNCKNLSYAIATILSGSAVGAANAESPADTSGQLEPITVTAQRRVENLQNVPITIQVLTADTLTQLNATTIGDVLKYLPNVTMAGAAPGQGNIYMRGLATTTGGIQAAGALSSFPNVAVYLDEQSGQGPERNLDIYAADLQRIEVLEGPQGTLFGAGAEAGVVRYITNKPKLDVTEGNVNAGYATTAHGGQSSNVDAMINLPIIPDTFAIRGVIYNDSRGGYINNIPGKFTRAPTDGGIVDYFGGVVPPNSTSINNNSTVAQAFNPVTYKGGRLEAAYKVNEDWDALITQSYQTIDSEGVFWQEQYDGIGHALPDLSVQLYNPSYNNDRFSNTAWTINGRVAQLKVVYTGAYLDRHADQQEDYTNYSRGAYAAYYQCNVPGSIVNGATTPKNGGSCFSPSIFWTDHTLMTHQSHELRVSTPDSWWESQGLRALGGVFWEQYKVHEQTDFFYGATQPEFVPIAPPAGTTANNPNVRPQGDLFFDDITRGYTQKAMFLSADYAIIPKKLIATIATRYTDLDTFEKGSTVTSAGCNPGGIYSAATVAYPCGIPASSGINLDAKHLDKSYNLFRSRANLTWNITDDMMVYATWSQGFRPGGFNRSQSVIKPTSPIYGLFTPPLAYAPDTLTNNELGWKTEWLNNRLQFNGAVYQEDWKNTQIQIFDPGVTGNLTFTTNGPTYRVRGIETSLVARVTHGLTVTGSAAWNSSEVVKTLSLINPNTGQPINIVNPFGALGTPLAQSPPFEANIRLRYEFDINDYHPFWQVDATHQSHSYATTDKLAETLQGATVAFDDPGFSTYDASVGIDKHPWTVQLYGTNLTDVRAILYANYKEYVKADTINVPRTIGVRFSYKF